MPTITADELDQVRGIALTIDQLTDQLTQLSSLESVGACLELRLAYAVLGDLAPAPPPAAGRQQPLPRQDIVDALAGIALQLQTLPSPLRLEDAVMTADTAVRAARQYLL